jgi:DNA-binding CsgD family transcriptional regulator
VNRNIVPMNCKEEQISFTSPDNNHCAQRRSVIEIFAETCRLTPTEMRVLEAVVEVGGIRETASALAISPTTVKTHLRHIFQKSGAKGQVDLVRMVYRFQPRSSEQ